MRRPALIRAWCAVAACLLCVLVPAAAQARSAFTVRGSVMQVDVTGAHPGAMLALVDARGRSVAKRRVDPLGALLFRHVRAAAGYRVTGAGVTSGRFAVLPDRSAPPSTRIYSQRIVKDGYGYLTTRDGTKLAIDVRLPSGGKGPFPTLIEYSGYGYADPAGPQNGISQVATLLGFAVVDVNMRGTGCSGGAFDYFEPLQSLDGYDVIETVARQPWVLHHKVGMIGISYGGISQLFVAATRPPSLSAIAPLSVLDSSITTLFAGGILNTGFALGWAQDRVHDARPASHTGGQAWALQRIEQGDHTCAANQALHDEAANAVTSTRANRYYVPSVADPLDPITFVRRIDVPTYLACQWTDEQTGGHCPALVAHFTGTQRKWFTFTNGVHADSLDPATFNRFYDFIELFVARQVPHFPATLRAEAPFFYNSFFGLGGVGLPPDPIDSMPSYGAALSAFERIPHVRILFDNGAGSATPGNPVPSFERSFPSLPVPGTRARSWYLRSGGGLGSAPTGGPDSFTANAHARPLTDFTGNTSGGPGGLWSATPPYHWTHNPAGTALSYMTAPLSTQTTIVGAGAVRLWVKSSTPDVDLQVTITEVRPDGKETFVQGGWVRASDRKLDPRQSTLLAPVLSLRRRDASPMPKGKFALVTVPLYYEGHVYRAGSRIRIIISAPNGDQPIWSFSETVPKGTARVTIAHSAAMPSRLILPVIPSVHAPSALPPCPGLRGEPCRAFRAL